MNSKETRNYDDPQYPFKGIWIPREIWLHPTLTPLQKCLVAEIFNLSTKGLTCFASDKHFSKIFQVSVGRIKNMLCELRSKGIIESYGFDENGRRLLRVKPDVTDSVTTDVTKPVTTDVTDSVTSNSLTSNSNKKLKTNEGVSAKELKAKSEAKLQPIIDKWHAVNLEVLGRKSSCKTNEAKLLQELFESGIEEPEAFRVLRLALKVPCDPNQKHFNYAKHAYSVAGFCKHFNNIQAEVDTSSNPIAPQLRACPVQLGGPL